MKVRAFGYASAPWRRAAELAACSGRRQVTPLPAFAGHRAAGSLSRAGLNRALMLPRQDGHETRAGGGSHAVYRELQIA